MHNSNLYSIFLSLTVRINHPSFGHQLPRYGGAQRKRLSRCCVQGFPGQNSLELFTRTSSAIQTSNTLLLVCFVKEGARKHPQHTHTESHRRRKHLQQHQCQRQQQLPMTFMLNFKDVLSGRVYGNVFAVNSDGFFGHVMMIGEVIMLMLFEGSKFTEACR